MILSRQIRKKIRQMLFAFGLTLIAAIAHAEVVVVVVVSAKSSVDGLSNHQVANIFLGKTSRLPNGEHVVPVDRADGAELRDAFYLKLLDMSNAQLKAHWSRLIFTGKGRPPKEVMSNKAMKQIISENPHAIGYIEASELDNSVRAVLVLP
jgi:ABC-type phosphate transport system substrate-binding protein